MKLLLLDDDPNMRRLIKLMFKNTKIQLDTVASGRTALRKLKDSSYDLIISDLQMPEMDGIAFLKELKAGKHTEPVIIMSAYGLQKMADMALDAGAVMVLEKPIQKEKLFKAVKKIISEGHK